MIMKRCITPLLILLVCSCSGTTKKSNDPYRKITDNFGEFVDSFTSFSASEIGRFDSLYKIKKPNLQLAFAKEFSKNNEVFSRRFFEYNDSFRKLDSISSNKCPLSIKKEFTAHMHRFTEHSIYLMVSFDELTGIKKY